MRLFSPPTCDRVVDHTSVSQSKPRGLFYSSECTNERMCTTTTTTLRSGPVVRLHLPLFKSPLVVTSEDAAYAVGRCELNSSFDPLLETKASGFNVFEGFLLLLLLLLNMGFHMYLSRSVGRSVGRMLWRYDAGADLEPLRCERTLCASSLMSMPRGPEHARRVASLDAHLKNAAARAKLRTRAAAHAAALCARWRRQLEEAGTSIDSPRSFFKSRFVCVIRSLPQPTN